MVALVITVLLFYMMQRWPKVGTAVRATMFVTGVIGLIILTKVGYTFELLKAVFMVPIDFIMGIFGIVFYGLFG